MICNKVRHILSNIPCSVVSVGTLVIRIVRLSEFKDEIPGIDDPAWIKPVVSTDCVGILLAACSKCCVGGKDTFNCLASNVGIGIKSGFTVVPKTFWGTELVCWKSGNTSKDDDPEAGRLSMPDCWLEADTCDIFLPIISDGNFELRLTAVMRVSDGNKGVWIGICDVPNVFREWCISVIGRPVITGWNE